MFSSYFTSCKKGILFTLMSFEIGIIEGTIPLFSCILRQIVTFNKKKKKLYYFTKFSQFKDSVKVSSQEAV